MVSMGPHLVPMHVPMHMPLAMAGPSAADLDYLSSTGQNPMLLPRAAGGHASPMPPPSYLQYPAHFQAALQAPGGPEGEAPGQQQGRTGSDSHALAGGEAGAGSRGGGGSLGSVMRANAPDYHPHPRGPGGPPAVYQRQSRAQGEAQGGRAGSQQPDRRSPGQQEQRQQMAGPEPAGRGAQQEVVPQQAGQQQGQRLLQQLQSEHNGSYGAREEALQPQGQGGRTKLGPAAEQQHPYAYSPGAEVTW